MHPSEFPGPIGILGYGVEGRSTCRYLLGAGRSDLIVFDRQPAHGLPSGVADATGEGYLGGLDRVRTLFRSAGVRPDLPELAAFRAGGGLLTSQVEHFFDLVPPGRIIGVTGTVGKGTCVSLLGDMLQAGGVPCALGGNIGLACLDLLPLAPEAVAVLELSSFQLSTLSRAPARAAVLRTTSEHLDWHPDQKEYWDHKANLARGQGPGDLLVYCADAPGSAWIAGRAGGRRLGYGARAEVRVADGAVRWPGGPEIKLEELKLRGAFNLENVAAAGTLALDLGVPPEAMAAAALAFTGLEHRLEFVRVHQGVEYVNDSYATRPEATMGALAALADEPLGLILGGSEKYADFGELVIALASAPQLKAVALIGQTSGRLEAEIRHRSPSPPFALAPCPDLPAALAFLQARVRQGAILLSPACASFGLFANYKERGRAFKALVNAL